MNPLFAAAICILLVNVPFGLWRAGTGRFSAPWFAAVHLPVLLTVPVRILCGAGWHLASVPVMVGAYCAGQYLGGALRARTRRDHD